MVGFGWCDGSNRAAERLKKMAVLGAFMGFAWLVLAQIELVGDFRVDDAYISFSYSKNLALGNGPVFSHGLRVEGYSNFLWVLCVAVGLIPSPHADPYTAARILAFGWLALGVVATYRLARCHAGRFPALLGLGLLLSCTDVVRAALSGLETVPFMAALVFGWAVYAREPTDSRRWSALAFLPAALMRIDGFVLVGVVVVLELGSQLLERRFRPGAVARWLLPALLPYLVYFAWRAFYYGLPLPSTVYAKSLVDSMEPERGMGQIWAFFREYGALWVVALVFVPLLKGPRLLGLGLAISVVGQFFYIDRVGGDWMPFRRFFLPILPLACVLIAWGIARVLDDVRGRPMPLRLGALAILSGMVWQSVRHANLFSLETPEERGKKAEAVHTELHVRDNLLATIDLMALVVREPGDRLVTDYAGVYSVYTDAAVIDMWGLCTPEIALRGGTVGINPIYGKECALCYAELDPDYFHVMVPIVRAEDSFRSKEQLLSAVFQGPRIDRVIGLRNNFAVGRVREPATARALWFFERRREHRELRPRHPRPGVIIDYPFETAKPG